MKRALFKLGEAFTIESSTTTDSFRVDLNVPEWQQQPEWDFAFTSIGPPGEPGTTITVDPLHESTSESFAQQSFLNRLARSLGAHHQQSTDRGLIITLNGAPVGGKALQLLNSDLLHPATLDLVLYENSEAPVQVRLYAGVVDSSEPQEAGWYVFCNGRLVVEADKTEETGWGASSETKFPRFHNRYARFRGYTFLDCDDASKLPWTTTKTGLDADSRLYRRVLQSMTDIARPITTFLYDIAREIENPPDEPGTDLQRLIDNAQPVRLSSLTTTNAPFGYKRPPAQRKPQVRTQSIQYRKPITQIEAVKKALHVASAAEAGQRTFDYFYKRECADE